ncbi:NAD(P)-binding protein, partial [Aureobasidium melanogenum]
LIIRFSNACFPAAVQVSCGQRKGRRFNSPALGRSAKDGASGAWTQPKLHLVELAIALDLIQSHVLPPSRPTSTTRPLSRFLDTPNTHPRLEGKTVVITGASSGIGKSTALEFARTSPKNLKLVVTARRLEALQQLKEDINKEVGEGVKVLPVKLDVSNPEEVKNFVGNLPEEFRDINVLVNNAGLVKGVAKAPSIAEQDMNIMFATNVTGLINMTQAILPIFLARTEGSSGLSGAGDIINVGSIAGREPYPGGSIYCATKAAVRSFTESLRKELIATRVRVIEIDPGQVETEFSVVRFYGDKKAADKVYEGCEPLTPEDIAEVVVFAAGRRENVVVADTLIYPNHQVCLDFSFCSLIRFMSPCCFAAVADWGKGRCYGHAQKDLRTRETTVR